MEIWSKQLPKDRTGQVMQEFAVPYQTLATTARDNATASSVTGLNANTTTVEVTAVTTGAGIRWATSQATSVITAAGTANFDNYVPEGTTRRFVVPRNTSAIPNYNANGTPSVVGLNTSEGLFNGIATKNSGVGSVLLTEY